MGAGRTTGPERIKNNHSRAQKHPTKPYGPFGCRLEPMNRCAAQSGESGRINGRTRTGPACMCDRAGLWNAARTGAEADEGTTTG